MHMLNQNTFLLNESFIAEMVQRICSAGNPIRIILFGSHARGDAHPDSDLDLLIVENSTLPRFQRPSQYRTALRGFHPSKDILVWTPDELVDWKNVPNAPINTILHEGRILYEKSS
jgi:uncharacterized protein